METASPPPPWWLTTSTACDLPSGGFLSTCSLQALLSLASAGFLAVLLFLQLRRFLTSPRRERSHDTLNEEAANKAPLLDRAADEPRSALRVAAARYIVALAASSLLVTFYALLLVLSVVVARRSSVQEVLLLALPCAAHLTAAVIVANERRSRAARQPLVLRIFWLAASALVAVAAVARDASDATTLPEGAISVAAFLLSLPLAVIAVSGATGIFSEEEEESRQFLLNCSYAMDC